jgi:hypothetical protein
MRGTKRALLRGQAMFLAEVLIAQMNHMEKHDVAETMNETDHDQHRHEVWVAKAGHDAGRLLTARATILQLHVELGEGVALVDRGIPHVTLATRLNHVANLRSPRSDW